MFNLFLVCSAHVHVTISLGPQSAVALLAILGP